MDRRGLAAASTAVAVAVAGSISIVITVLVRTGLLTTDRNENDAAWLLAEPLVLAGLVFVVVRWSPPRAAAVAGSLAAAGSALWVQRFLSDEPPLDAVFASAVWLIPSLAAGTVAWYLCWAAAERTRAIALARAEQRLRLALDLHDFVAHDISEIVARAQAGAAVLPLDDPRVAELLGQIESAGLRALESMDQAVHALGEGQDPVRLARGGIDDIDELVRRFASAGELEAVVERRLIREVDATIGAEAYRVVVEALTNVRRHAVRATQVTVVLNEVGGGLLVSIVDDGDGRSATARQAVGGLGLVAMTDRVERLRGSVEAGPLRSRGWQVTVALPLSRNTDQGATA
ncbi:sensor histidine kinase [Agromyces laixinhei]|uniref:sensor histidine kinase n=1 Tax=Agromyces laixinhei TaxID=2585717 RepID=UPI0018DBB28F|nr:ATP-binding protein [Agromyces laixinhei]